MSFDTRIDHQGRGRIHQIPLNSDEVVCLHRRRGADHHPSRHPAPHGSPTLPRSSPYHSDPETAVYQAWSVPLSVEQAEGVVTPILAMDGPQFDEWYLLGIVLPGDDTLVGDVAIHLEWDGNVAAVGRASHRPLRLSGAISESGAGPNAPSIAEAASPATSGRRSAALRRAPSCGRPLRPGRGRWSH